MRAKVVFALGLAASLAGGLATFRDESATAGVLPYRMSIPGIAVDSGETGPVTAGHVSARNDGSLVVTGDVTNGTSVPISNVQLLVHATVGGQAVTRSASALVTRIAPGSTSPFNVTFALPGDLTGITVEVVGFDRSYEAPAATFAFAGPYPFQVGPPDPKTGKIPYSTVLEQLKGQVTNRSGRPISAIDIVVAIYDGSGNVAWVGTGAELQVPFEVPGGIQQLEDGQTGTFIVGLPIGLLNSVPGQSSIRGFLNADLQ